MTALEALGNEGKEPFIPEDSFGLRLVMVRRHLGLTQSEAATVCGLDDGSWSNWEKGSKPRDLVGVVNHIVEHLHVDRDWLMWGGPIRTGSFSSVLSAVATLPGQGTLLNPDLSPLDFYSKPELALV